MNRILPLAVLSLSLFGCQAARAEETSKAGATAAKAPRVGTDPGKVGYGTSLTAAPGHELAAFAAGCFWGVEDAFRKVPGVTATAVGYTGGHTKDPTYPKVCGHDTGHAETVLVEFDPAKISYEKLLVVFFRIHDPTTLNYQGPDYGDQYRSAIFTFSPKQAAAAKKAIERTQDEIHEKVVTQVSPIGPFYKAEAYHQQYAERTGTHGCPVRGFNGAI
ncbi:MAG TPA: peptide-methionine (S)-S-oxide reductase MsrA [Polyangiaceae bacterium]|nr:peptide-methionine (S)-S-oxide reductase MsrA [Polyangiaceae bacterium]